MADGSYLVPFMMTPSMVITMAPFLGIDVGIVLLQCCHTSTNNIKQYTLITNINTIHQLIIKIRFLES
jgi:hypothetical protein